MDLKKLEFEMLLAQIEDSTYSISDGYTVNLIDDGIIIKLKNKDITINLDKIITFQAQKLKEDLYKFQTKSEYLRFDDPRKAEESYLYKRLFGYNMRNDFKQLLIFLGSLPKEELPQYMLKVPVEANRSIKKFFESEINGSK